MQRYNALNHSTRWTADYPPPQKKKNTNKRKDERRHTYKGPRSHLWAIGAKINHMIMRTHAFRLRVKITIKMISVNGGWIYLEDCLIEMVILLLLIRDPHTWNCFLNTTYIYQITLVLKFTSILSSTPYANNTFQRIISHMLSQIEITRWLTTFFRYPNNKIEVCNRMRFM